MNRHLWIFAFVFIFISKNTEVFAQESDPYSDYSHLWDTPEKKKKEKKSKKIEPATSSPSKSDSIPKQEQTSTPEVKIDSTNSSEDQAIQATDSLPKAEENVISSDSTSNEKPSSEEETFQDTAAPEQPVLVSDTVPKPEEPIIPSGSTLNENSSPIEEIQEEIPAPGEEPQKKEKRERVKPESTGPPVEDFRGGMGNMNSGSSFNGGFTATVIDDQLYVGLTLSPELKIWKIGIGLNVPILFNVEDQSFRSEIFKGGVGLARLVNYARYGVQKKDPVYVKVGELNGTMIGFGGLVNNYTNTVSFENRKVGLHYDINYKGYGGIEGLYSDFDPSSTNLLVIRPYIRPLSFTSLPIVKTLEIGASIARDNDQTKRPLSDSTSTTYSFTRGGIGAFALDAGVTLLRVPFIQIDAFVNFSTLNVEEGGLIDSLANTVFIPGTEPSAFLNGFENGRGFSYGLNFRFHFIANVLSTDIRIDRLNYSEHYIPQFFDASYEINKDARIWSLVSAESQKGIYGSLTGHILQKVQLGGSLLLPESVTAETPAVVQVNAIMDRLLDKYSLNASYIKGGLIDLEDAFKLDERSIAKVRMIYHMNKYLATGLDYYWTFTQRADGSYKSSRYISPYFGLSIQF